MKKTGPGRGGELQPGFRDCYKGTATSGMEQQGKGLSGARQTGRSKSIPTSTSYGQMLVLEPDSKAEMRFADSLP